MKKLILFLLCIAAYGQKAVMFTGQGIPISLSAGSGTVTSLTIAGTANQVAVSGTCTITTTGTCTISLPSGLVLPGTINGLTLTTSTGTFTLTNAKTFTVNNTLTIQATDGTTLVVADPASVTNNDCVKFTKSGSVLTLADAGACGSGAAAVSVTTTFSATPDFQCPSATDGTIVNFFLSTELTEDITASTLTGCGTNGQILVFTIEQNGEDSFTMAYPTGFDRIPPIDPTAESVTTFAVRWDGTTATLLSYGTTGPPSIIMQQTVDCQQATTGNAVLCAKDDDTLMFNPQGNGDQVVTTDTNTQTLSGKTIDSAANTLKLDGTTVTGTDGTSGVVCMTDGASCGGGGGGGFTTVVVDFSSADILALGTPKTLVAAQGANTVILPYTVACYFTAGGSQYTGGADPSIYYQSNSFAKVGTTTLISASAIRSASSGFYWTNTTRNENDNGFSASANKALVMQASDFSAGNGTMRCVVTYSVADFN